MAERDLSFFQRVSRAPRPTPSKVQQVARDALFTVYEDLRSFSGKTIENVRFTSVPQMQAVEQQTKPNDSLILYPVFKEMGLSEEELHDLYYSTPRIPFYADYQKGVLYMPEHVGASFRSSSSDEEYSQAAMLLGGNFIRASLRRLSWSLPHIFNQDDERVLINAFGVEFENLANLIGNGLTDAENPNFRRGLALGRALFTRTGLDFNNGRILGLGADVMLIFNGQQLMGAEYLLNPEFDDGVMNTLATPVDDVFRKLMSNRFNIRINPRNTRRTPNTSAAICEVLALSGNDLLKEYIHSNIAQLILDSTDPAIDLSNYGALANEYQWLSGLLDSN